MRNNDARFAEESKAVRLGFLAKMITNNIDTEPLLDHREPSIPQESQTRRKKPSPYAICLPLTIFIVIVGMMIGVIQQWTILYLCARYNASSSNQSFPTLPGFFNTPPVLMNPSWEYCSKIPQVQVLHLLTRLKLLNG